MKKYLVVGLLAAVLPGCSAAGEESAAGDEIANGAEEQVGHAQEALGIQDGAYMQEQGSPRVFWLHSGHFCWVYDPGELAALQHVSRGNWDGFSRPRFTDIQAAGYRYDGSCGYPNGMYRRDGAPEVYSVAGASYCHVKDNRQVNLLGGWANVLVVKVKPNEFDPGEYNAVGPNQRPLGHPRLSYEGDCNF